jgi:hypothetical protein
LIFLSVAGGPWRAAFYFIVTSNDTSELPEAASLLPVAVIAKVSVPFPFAVYWYVDVLTFFSFPRLGFLAISELWIVPNNLSGN